MAKRKSRPKRDTILYVAQTTIEDFPNVDLSQVVWIKFTPEAAEQLQQWELRLQHLAAQAEALGEALAEAEKRIKELETESKAKDDELERFRKIEAKTRRHRKGRRNRGDWQD